MNIVRSALHFVLEFLALICVVLAGLGLPLAAAILLGAL